MCESLAKGIPIIISAAIPGQESYNAEWLIRYKAAFQVKNVNDIKCLVADILDKSEVLESARQGIRQIAKPYAARDLVNFLFNQGSRLR